MSRAQGHEPDSVGGRGRAPLHARIKALETENARLRDAEAWYRALFKHTSDAAFLHEVDENGMPGALVDANDGALALFGYDRDEFLAIHYRAILCDGFIPAATPGLLVELQTNGKVSFEISMRRKDGSTFPADVRAHIFTLDGHQIGLITVRDIAGRKRAEDELRTSHTELRSVLARLERIREEERTTLARELHDNLGQALTAMKLDIAWLARHMPPAGDLSEQEAIASKTRELGELVDEAFRTSHGISNDLRPASLDVMGLWPALGAEAARFTGRTGIACIVRPCDDLQGPTDRAVATSVFRIVQEALANVARHSGATEVTIACFPDGNHHNLTIVDNGSGISPEALNGSESLGLIGMRERGLSFGGDVTVTGEPGKGSTVTVRVPARMYTEGA